MKSMDQFVDEESANLTPEDRIDLICDVFEQEWLDGKEPRIEEFLERAVPEVRAVLLTELLLVDREFRIKSGQSVSREDYRQRFPEYSDIIAGLDFAKLDDHQSARPTALRQSRIPASSDKLGQFELLEELGAGAFGTVWKARDTRLRRLVAIKMPRQEKLSETERDRFVREGQACAQLRHPNIVAVYEVGEDHGRAFIVTEFIDGLNLRDWLRERPPKPKQAAELIAQLAEALHHAHEQGVIHRDLKPANVLMDSDGHPHITDFGLAKWTTDSACFTIEGNVLGTPAYMSPEQARGEAFKVDRRSDVYGLGALLYEMIAGRPPFEGELASVVHQVIHNEPTHPRKIDTKVPRDLETICLKAMEKEPQRRYPSAQEIAVDLRRYMRGDAIIARRANPIERSYRWLRRRPAVAALLVLAAILLGASMMIASLTKKNYELQGYRVVRISTDPQGARVALVPIDERSGEPDPDPANIISPAGVTPLIMLAKPGNYFLEAVVERGGARDLAEEYISIPRKGVINGAPEHKGRNNEHVEDLFKLRVIVIRPMKEVIRNMVAVPIDDELRHTNPLLPDLLYVDINQHKLSDGQKPGAKGPELFFDKNGISFVPLQLSLKIAAELGKRLPSAAEYEAIVQALKEQKVTQSDSKSRATIEGLFDGVAEWTTTRYHFTGRTGAKLPTGLETMNVMKGYGSVPSLPNFARSVEGLLLASPSTESAAIAFRCVRSGAPRFIKP